METSICGKNLLMNSRSKNRLPVDPFVLGLFGMILFATLFPCQGWWAEFAEKGKFAAIVLLFFLHGARLSRESIQNGLLNWKLQAATLWVTFGLFPIIGLLMIRIPGVPQELLPGLCFLTLLPSTVQSSIAFTALSKGNVAAAVCAATLSNLVGVFATPLLVAIAMPHEDSATSGNTEVFSLLDSIGNICIQLLLPFILGHFSRPFFGRWVDSHKPLLSYLDRGSILLVVYTAFSAAVVQGIWRQTSLPDILCLIAACGALLGIIFSLTWRMGRWLRLQHEDTLVLFYCGSKKSLATGVPIAGTLFAASDVGLLILPLMVYHQIQLLVCAWIAPKLIKTDER